jgi:hypothetical protein
VDHFRRPAAFSSGELPMIDAFGLMTLWLWVGSIVLSVVLGLMRGALGASFLAALLFGPLGMIAALGFDGRLFCPVCAGRLDGKGKICQHCRAPLAWSRNGLPSVNGDAGQPPISSRAAHTARPI